jgi:hypothetical protein
MAEQVGPRGSKPDRCQVLRGRLVDEDFPGEFHQGQQAYGLHQRPDIRLQPDLKRQKHISLAKPGGVHIRHLKQG